MSECIFCKIVAGELPEHNVYEDDQVVAFLDIYPTVEGYTVVIPKVHTDYVWDMDSAAYQHLMDVSRSVALKIRQTLKPKYVGLKIEGTHLAHSHVKVFPFANHDEYARTPDFDVEPDHDALAKVARRLKIN